jgi:hypothetical protein
MKDATLIRIGVIGAIVAALCCVTPMSVILLGLVLSEMQLRERGAHADRRVSIFPGESLLL